MRTERYILSVVASVLLFFVGIYWTSTKLTFLEQTSINDREDFFVTLDSDDSELCQEFIMPYEIIDSIAIKIGTFDRDNNSSWIFSLYGPKGETIYEGPLYAIKLNDGDYFRYEFDNRITVTKGERYSFTIRAEDVDEISGLSFSIGEAEENTDLPMTVDGERHDGVLCFKVYGGDRDYWWRGFIVILFVFVLSWLTVLFIDYKQDKRVSDDKIAMGMMAGVITFLLLFSFAFASGFTDEFDNFLGARIIADGGVLYKDYITQHTPVLYYLCSLFSLMGARSVEQFRLSYYLLECIVWMLVYIRHSSFYGRKKMLALPILESIFMTSVVGVYGCQVLSDGVQGILFVVLMLEFLRFHEDHKLDWVRCVIVSVCLWGSIGVAFVSVYPLFLLAICFLCSEIKYINNSKPGIRKLLSDYCRLFVTLSIPPVLTIAYFVQNDALDLAYDQAYVFNREIYPIYYAGFGDRFFDPFIYAVKYFFEIISTNVNNIINADSEGILTILQLFLILLAVCVMIKLVEQRKYMVCISLGVMLVFSAARGYTFHGLPSWYIALLTVVLFIDLFKGRSKIVGKPVIGLLAIILTSSYFISVSNNYLNVQSLVSDIDSQIIKITENDEDRNIYLGLFATDPLYLYAKGRKPVNPLVYMLPWYMDRYETVDIEALINYMPHVVLYDEDREIWGNKSFSNGFDEVLEENYICIENGDYYGDIWVYFPSDDASGWIDIEGLSFYLDDEGNRLTGWQTIDGKRYYFESDGRLVTGWRTMSGKTYYFDSDGVMHSGWLAYEGNNFYFKTNGIMLQDTTRTFEGITYVFDYYGVCTNYPNTEGEDE